MSTKDIRILPVIWRRLFTSPHLSRTLILSSGLVIFTNMMVVFISQPAGYWVDYRYASVGNVWLQQVMAYHPAAFAGLMLGYVLLLWLLLDGLTFRAALVVWMGVAFVHLYDIYGLADDALFRNVQLAPLWLELSSIGIVLGLSAGLGVVIERTYPDERMAHKRPLRSRSASWNWKGLAFGAGWCALLLFGLIYTIQRPFTGWREITPEAGPARVAGAGVAYDSSRQRTVMFGGASDWTEDGWEYRDYTYEWDGDRWHLFSSGEISSGARLV